MIRWAERWRLLSGLLTALEHGVEGLARMETYAATPGAGRPAGPTALERSAFDRRLRHLEDRIDHELDRLTAERLTFDLAAKQARDAA